MPIQAAGTHSIYCEIQGDGPPIVLLHGIGSNSKAWWRQFRAFAPHLKVVAWDAPGFGRSSDPAGIPSMAVYADALRDLLDSLHLETATILGHSLGGLIAQEFYRRHPERVAALILSDTSRGGGADSPEERARRLSARLDAVRNHTPEELARSRAPLLLSSSANQELTAEVIAVMSELRPSGYEFAARAMADADMRGVLDNVMVPLLMIWGEEDSITPVWKQTPQRASVQIISGARHLCYAEQPERFNSIVLGFMEWITTESR